jgi:selenobiotic family peptide radical SAM maturase
MPESSSRPDPLQRYPVCLTIMPDLKRSMPKRTLLSEFLQNSTDRAGFPPYLVDLARIEESRYALINSPQIFPESVQTRMVNPAFDLLTVNWSNLPEFIMDQSVEPVPGTAYVIVWIRPGPRDIRISSADTDDLLALKIVAEGMDTVSAAAEGGISAGAVENLLFRGQQRGLILAPDSLIRRHREFPAGEISNPEFFSSKTFTLQWHVTQACDLNCRHCYDRSERKTMTLQQALRVLDTLHDFCSLHHVYGHVSFSGGNPMLYPHFDRVYKEAADRGFMTAVLGNPMPVDRIEKMMAVQKPGFYQVSLEGMKAHNDYIRGTGHYHRTIDFLKLLGDLGIYRMVMLTLTRHNMDDVLELAESLNGRAELFTFNRLASVGQGAQLPAVTPELFPDFLRAYMKAAKSNPVMAYKDNLFNLLKWREGVPVGGGCTGHGCGAAFNFVSVLPDGEVHACRKFPSWIGNIYEQSLSDIYHGFDAEKYRGGSIACGKCPVRPVCGGCLAVGYGYGIDIFNEKDPYCFCV